MMSNKYDVLRTACAKVVALAGAVERTYDDTSWPQPDRELVENLAQLIGMTHEAAQAALTIVDAAGAQALNPRLGDAAEGWDDGPREDTGLAMWDMDLIGWVAGAAREHRNHDVILQVFSLPADARRRIDDAIGRMHGTHVVGGPQALDPAEKQRAIDEVYAELHRAGRSSWVGDLLVMTREERAARPVTP